MLTGVALTHSPQSALTSISLHQTLDKVSITPANFSTSMPVIAAMAITNPIAFHNI